MLYHFIVTNIPPTIIWFPLCSVMHSYMYYVFCYETFLGEWLSSHSCRRPSGYRPKSIQEVALQSENCHCAGSVNQTSEFWRGKQDQWLWNNVFDAKDEKLWEIVNSKELYVVMVLACRPILEEKPSVSTFIHSFLSGLSSVSIILSRLESNITHSLEFLTSMGEFYFFRWWVILLSSMPINPNLKKVTEMALYLTCSF